jgi:2-(1,2-epoxy-1,2-dihydrophenyl)acetyl-CoA isomerase
MSTEGLRVARDERGVLRLTLDRPEKRNAITDAMMAGLLAELEAASTDENVRAIVLDGAGEHFCGGFDIVARNADRDARPRAGSIQRRLPSQAHRLIPLLLRVQTPVVCVVHGWAAGIGFQLALASDFTIAADDARFWEPFAERGFTPDSGATWLLPRRVGVVRARELVLLGRALSGTEAAEWGAIHRAVPMGVLPEAVDEVVNRLATGPTVALGLAKWLLHTGEELALEPQLANEAFAMELSSRSDDFREGLKAFGEKRPPEFGGR